MARASALAAAGRRDSALAVYRRIGSDHPEHVAAPLAAAQLLTAGAVDTTEWSIADSLLVAVAERADGEAVRQSVAAIYLNAGMRLVQARAAAELAANWLDQALRYGTDSQIVARAQLFRAVALFYVIQEVDLRARAEQTCELVAREAELVVAGWAAADAARAQYPDAIGQVVAGLEAYEGAVEELRTALRCGPG
jgi:tetratricopeptide (TPR) repeat protein